MPLRADTSRLALSSGDEGNRRSKLHEVRKMRPTNKSMDGEYRHIQIELVHNSYKLAYRRGYNAEDAKSAQAAAREPASDPLLPLVKFGMPDFTQFSTRFGCCPQTPSPRPRQNGSAPTLA